MADTTSTSLRHLTDAIVAGDQEQFSSLLRATPSLAAATFAEGATRRQAAAFFIEEIAHQIYSGDTALHIAAAAYRHKMASALIKAGANVRAGNRRGAEPLHAASVGNPSSPTWNPEAQAATIAVLIAAGADPNAQNMDGATPLHRAVRTRCAAAVKTLLTHGSTPALRNKSGSTPLQLAQHTTGRGGSGSPEAKTQQQQIIHLLQNP